MNTWVLPIVSSVIGAIATVVLTVIAGAVSSIRTDVHRFMLEHLYLLRVADWTKVNLTDVFAHLNLTPTEPAPSIPKDKQNAS